jgi:hypothetical protein
LNQTSLDDHSNLRGDDQTVPMVTAGHPMLLARHRRLTFQFGCRVDFKILARDTADEMFTRHSDVAEHVGGNGA